jgi:ligand-binding sensor domain-containing protein/serine phosphatase RsbU (regulator of sigma subunit)
MKKIFLLVWVFSFIPVFSSFSFIVAQYYKFQKFGGEKGICHPFVYGVNQDKNGFIWALTGTGLCRFDGFNFTKNGDTRDSLPESSAEVSYADKNGNLWFGYSDGSIVVYDTKKFKLLKPNENSNGKITTLITDPYERMVASSQNVGLVLIDKNLQQTIVKEPFENKLVYAINFIDPNRLLVGTDDGLWMYSYGVDIKKIKPITKIMGVPETKINKIIKWYNHKGFWVATEDAGLFMVSPLKNNTFEVDNFGGQIGLGNDNVQSVFEDSLSHVWISTFGKGIFKVEMNIGQIKNVTNYNYQNGLGRDDIKEVFQDREGNIWVATFGGGLANLLNESFISYDFKNLFKDNNIHAVCFDENGYWLGGNKGLIRVKTDNPDTPEFYGKSSGVPDDIISALYIDTIGTLWIGTSRNGIFRLAHGSKKINSFFHGENLLDNSINTIAGKGNRVYAGTKNGVYTFNLLSGQQQHASTSQGLPHNDIHQVYVDVDGHAWIATHSNTLFALGYDSKFNIKGGGEIEFTSITRDAEGSMWAGTNGSGLFKFTKDTFYYFSAHEGLKSDYCYAILNDKFGDIWVGHRLGLSRINTKTHKVRVYGTEYFSGDINPNAISENASGHLLFGTTDGLLLYEPSKDKKAVTPPVLNITSITINDSAYDISKKIILPYAHYRVKIDFIGLNFSNPDQVTYQYKLKGFDTEWSEVSSGREAKYPRLEEGNYVFMVKACNGEGGCIEVPLTFEFKINKPFWKTWWFTSATIIALVFFVYLIIKARERKHREFQAHLERLLEERTREVREQKEEIELKNRDITDSINYAQRIQASILPSLRKLQHIFTGSFVFYLPRNIVSGDFYWFEVFPKTNKFLIVCADSTGHGVPGAFMSIIGTALLKDIFSRPEVQTPADILQHLDNELKSTLNQNSDGEHSNDGMDIIVCEIDIKTYLARFSSAMRPFIVYQNGEQIYFKGSRSSIGGQAKEQKVFEDIELQLTKGDLIYMFSDGYPDQFGGPLEKKFKMVRLRNLLKDIHQKPMEEQYNYVRSNFELWKGDMEQIDDVLFMGIKI